MGFMDSVKGMVSKGKDLAGDHADKVQDGIDKAADVADDKTGGKYSDQIDSGAEKAKDFVEGLDDDN
ncbi:MAG: antitoxin [Armatimonadetes bacterium]|nr:MAG: antitoxin [Armatimonadota bacterium]